MSALKIAARLDLVDQFKSNRDIVDIESANLVEVAVIVIHEKQINTAIIESALTFNLPICVFCEDADKLPIAIMGQISAIFLLNHPEKKEFYSKQIEFFAEKYTSELLPPFFGRLAQYTSNGYAQFDCPGHQGGDFYRKHPAGNAFINFFGESLFRSDLCNADVALGDLLIHEGAACKAQQHAAQVFNADKTYFVLNGTSASNKVVLNALLTPGDIVLFDRNNHKSVYQGALMQAGAHPIYLETTRNPFGFIGGIEDHCFDENYIRELIKESYSEKADLKRPIRLAVIQLGTYDGTIYNARQVVDRIGHLCDYILFDSAWVGYEQFIPMMKNCSPLLLELNENDPGIFVTQSVHKQQAGFSQASQIHKKDKHIKGQKRYVSHKRLNNAFMMHASTSPFYPLFASLDVNAKMHSGKLGQKLWQDCVRVGIETRKMLLQSCKYIKPFIPTMITGKKWESYPTEQIAQDIQFFNFEPNADWHSFEGYSQNQYFVDPCKLLLTTSGINIKTKEYESFGIPATILANYLRENGIIPEKCDLNSILFLLTPAETTEKMQRLVSAIVKFEQLIDADEKLEVVLPSIYAANQERYQGYTLRQLCQEMHNLYVKHNIKELQKEMFMHKYFPPVAMSAQQANIEFIRGEHIDLVPITEVLGEIAAEGALPYPPGILCVVPGERWTTQVQTYFLALEEGINKLPGFSPELQGVYIQEVDGYKRAFGHIIRN